MNFARLTEHPRRFMAGIMAARALNAAAESFSPLGLMRRQAGYVRGVRVIELESFDNVIATGKATAKWEKIGGSSLDRIILQLGGGAFTKAMITGVKISVDETPVYEDTGSRIDTRMQYRGLTANAGFLALSFVEERAITPSQRHAGAIDMRSLGAKRITAEIDIAGATTPTLTPFAMVGPSPQSNSPLYNLTIGKTINKTATFAAAGEFTFPLQYKKNNQSFLKRVHFFGATVTALRVRKTYPDGNTDEFFKAADAVNDFIQTEFQNVPQANVVTFDAIWDRDLGRALPLGDAMQIEWFVTVNGAGNVTAVSELLDPLANN